MLRWFGGVLIVLGGVLARQRLVEGERLTQKTRRELAEALEAMEQEIRLLLTPVPKLLRRRYGETADAFFASVSRALERGAPLAEGWRASAEALALPPPERAQVASLGRSIGGGEESVCASLTLTATTLRRQYEEAERERSKRERLKTTLCLSASLLLLILLL